MKNLFLTAILLTIVFSCKEDDIFTLPEIDNAELKAASISYSVSLTAPTSILLYGKTITISGIVKDNKGNYFANQNIGVDDGVGMMCRLIKTDKNGKFSFSTKVQAKGVAIIEIIVNGTRYPFLFQAASKKVGSTYHSTGLNVSAFKVKNPDNKSYKVKTSTGNLTYYQVLNKKSTQTLIKAPSKSKAKRITKYAGAQFTVGLVAGGSASVTVDENYVGTTAFSAGIGLLRGQVYATTKADFGACWAPGVDLGATPISLSAEVALCLGSDGVNISPSGSVGPVVGGFSVKIY